MAPQSLTTMVAANSAEVVSAANQLRQRFFESCEDKSDIYDKRDLDRLQQDDFYCQRFIYHQMMLGKESEQALEMVQRFFKWRKEFGANDIKSSEFPEEMFKWQAIFPYRKDKVGNISFLMKACTYFKDSGKKTMYRRYLIHMLETLEKKYDGKKRCVFLVDCTDAGLKNIDLDWSFFVLAAVTKNYPAILDYILVYKMPAIFQATWQIVKNWLNKGFVERVLFLDEKAILDYVDAEDLPESMGGLDKNAFPLANGQFSAA